MMKLSYGAFILILTLALLGQSPPKSFAKEPEPNITDIIITTSESHLLLYSSVKDCFNKEMLTGVRNGIPVTFTFWITLEQIKRNWPDTTLVKQTLTHTLTYDTLKEKYSIEILERNNQKIIVDSPEKAMELMAELSGIKIIEREKLTPDSPYALHIKVKLAEKTLPLNMHYIVPFISLWNIETDWRTIEFRY
ncbi:MAG: DUF4390 domain-containing protein [Desulfobulbaceae bacterium]|nr:DUF4390 domain-containing protein [Desulfobulbaceae bacterium]